jgi:excisionase family DNA binding protein
MDREIILISPKSLKGLLSEVVAETLKNFFNKDTKEADNRLYTRKQVSQLLGISLVTLGSWTKNGMIRAFRIGNSVRYKAEDVEKSLLNIKSMKHLRGYI